MDAVKIPINYIGSKNKLLDQTLPLFPKNINNFVDLFCGSLSISLNVDAKKIYSNDSLTPLIKMHEAFKNSDDNVIDRIEEIKRKFNNVETKKDYYDLRQEYNNNKDSFYFFLLICFSFCNKIRFNKNGLFSETFGNLSFTKEKKDLLIDSLLRLRKINIVFSNLDFNDFDLSFLNKNDFVYCDPPYFNSSVEYNKGFNENKEKQLLNKLDYLNNRGIKFALSNFIIHKDVENTELKNWAINNKYSIIYINTDKCGYKRGKNATGGETKEVLVINYNPDNIQPKLF